MGVLFCDATNLSAQDKDIKALAGTFADTLSKKSKKTVAVVDFTDLQGNVTELGRYLAEQVSVALAMTDKGVEVVDRTHLKALLQENKLNSSGLIDPATARKLGQIAGVEILVTGSLTPFGDSVQLAVKALDTTTARIIAASTTDIAKTKAIEELLNRGISASGVSPPASGIATAPGTTARTGGMTREMHQFSVSINVCKLSGDAMVCQMQITNRADQDRSFSMATRNGSRIIDQSGLEYFPVSARIGAQQNMDAWGQVQNTLISGVPMSAEIRFAHVSPDVGVILVELTCKNGTDDFKLQFRGVPVLK